MPKKAKTSVQKEIEERDSRIRELEEKIKYLQADFENYKKSLNKERAEFERRAAERIIRDLLCFLDDFEHAISNAGNEKSGLEMLHKRLMSILERHGLKPIDALGKRFDHYYHEAVMSEKSGKEDGIILEVFQKGYMLNSRVIRHSKVKVSKK